MKKKITLSSIFAATILIAMSLVSVVSYQSAQAQENNDASPLFAVRTQRATHTGDTTGIATFLGKGASLHIFPIKNTRAQLITEAIQMFSTNPALLNRLFGTLDKFPALSQLLIKYHVNTMEIKNYMKLIQDNPLLLTENIDEIQVMLPPVNGPQPLGLNTSNPLGCFIIAIAALVPITITLTLLILFFTIRIFTCMNINDCANNIAEQIWNQLIQGLTQS
jgi:hypothetical protein